jgi:hypothetical protein
MAHGTITAANGDVIYWEWVRTSNPPLVTITGRTGRFEGASGEFIMDIEPVGIGGHWTLTVKKCNSRIVAAPAREGFIGQGGVSA